MNPEPEEGQSIRDFYLDCRAREKRGRAKWRAKRLDELSTQAERYGLRYQQQGSGIARVWHPGDPSVGIYWNLCTGSTRESIRAKWQGHAQHLADLAAFLYANRAQLPIPSHP